MIAARVVLLLQALVVEEEVLQVKVVEIWEEQIVPRLRQDYTMAKIGGVIFWETLMTVVLV